MYSHTNPAHSSFSFPGRSPELREDLIESFHQLALEMGIPEDSIFILANRGNLPWGMCLSCCQSTPAAPSGSAKLGRWGMVRREGGETNALVAWDEKEIRPCISHDSTREISFQSERSMLGCQVNAATPLCWDEGMGHLCLVSRLGAASTWEAPCSVCSSEGATMIEDVWGGVVGVWGCVYRILGAPKGAWGFQGDGGRYGHFRMVLL